MTPQECSAGTYAAGVEGSQVGFFATPFLGSTSLTLAFFEAAMAERDSEYAGLLSEGTWATLKCSRDGFDRRFVFRVLSQLFHISTGPIATNNAFSRGNSPGHQPLLFISQA